MGSSRPVESGVLLSLTVWERSGIEPSGSRVQIEFYSVISVVLGCVESGISTKSANSESAGSGNPN